MDRKSGILKVSHTGVNCPSAEDERPGNHFRKGFMYVGVTRLDYLPWTFSPVIASRFESTDRRPSTICLSCCIRFLLPTPTGSESLAIATGSPRYAAEKLPEAQAAGRIVWLSSFFHIFLVLLGLVLDMAQVSYNGTIPLCIYAFQRGRGSGFFG